MLYVGDTHIVSKKRLLWSGNEYIGSLSSLDIYTHTESLIGKKLEIWVYDSNRLFSEPITTKVRALGGTNLIVKKNCFENNSFNADSQLKNTILELRYYPNTYTIAGSCVQHLNKVGDTSDIINPYDCYVEEIYEIIE